MHSFIKGSIFGIAIASAALTGYAYGTNEDRSNQPNDVSSHTPEFLNQCQVDVGWGRYTPGDECRYNQVMVGSRDGYLLCADIEVNCPAQ